MTPTFKVRESYPGKALRFMFGSVYPVYFASTMLGFTPLWGWVRWILSVVFGIIMIVTLEKAFILRPDFWTITVIEKEEM